MAACNATQHNTTQQLAGTHPPSPRPSAVHPTEPTDRRPSMCQKAGCCREKPRAAGRHLEHVVPERDANATVRRKILGRLIQLKKSSHSERACFSAKEKTQEESSVVTRGCSRPAHELQPGRRPDGTWGSLPSRLVPFFPSRVPGWMDGGPGPARRRVITPFQVGRSPGAPAGEARSGGGTNRMDTAPGWARCAERDGSDRICPCTTRRHGGLRIRPPPSRTPPPTPPMPTPTPPARPPARTSGRPGGGVGDAAIRPSTGRGAKKKRRAACTQRTSAEPASLPSAGVSS